MSRSEMVEEILNQQNRVNEHYFKREQLETFEDDFLKLLCDASKNMVIK